MSLNDTPNLEAIIAQLGDFSHDAIVIVETKPLPLPQGGFPIVWCNKAFSQMSGFAREDVVGRSTSYLRENATTAEEAQIIRKQLASGKKVEQDILSKTLSGEPYWVRLTIHPVADEKGEVRYWVAVGQDVTGIRLAEVEKEKAQKRLKLAEANVNVGFWTFDLSSNTLTLDKSGLEILGYTEDADATFGIGSIKSIWNADDWDALYPQLIAAASGQPTDDVFENRLLKADGTWISARSQLRLIGTGGRDGSLVVGTLHDVRNPGAGVTGCCEASDEVGRKDAQLKAIARSARLGMWRWDVKTGKVWMNDEWFSLLGYRPDELPQSIDTFEDNLHPEDKPRLRAATDAMISGDEAGFSIDFRMRSKSGEWTWLSTTGCVMERDEAGTPTLITGTHADIKQRKDNEAELQRLADAAELHRDRMGKLVDQAPGALYEFKLNPDKSVSFPYISERFPEVYGIDRDEFMERVDVVFDNVHPDDVKPLWDSIMRSAEALSRWSFRYRINHPLGERWLEGRSEPKLQDDGSIVWSGYLHDVTEQVLREQDLESARSEAEAATEAKSQFLANMSHEIRTPLNGVLGMAQALRDTNLDDVQAEYLSSIIDAGEGLSSVLNDILDFSKIESKLMEVKPRPFDLRSLCERVHRVHATRAMEKGLELSLAIDACEYDGRVGDPDRIQQVLHNLVGNAIKFTKKGRVLIRVSGSDGCGEQVRFQVSDTGCGISQSHLPKLFERFNQADASSKREHQGTGLGLSISRGLVDVMGGRIWVESEEGVGTDVWFTLPLKPVELEAKEAEAPVQMAAPSRILYVDDTAINQQVIAALLTPLGHTVTAAYNGREGVDAFQAGSFDLVLMDIQMPVMDGIEALFQIRDWEESVGQAPTSIIALSGNAMKHQVKEYFKAGFDEVLSKPIRKDRLMQAIAQFSSAQSDDASSDQEVAAS